MDNEQKKILDEISFLRGKLKEAQNLIFRCASDMVIEKLIHLPKEHLRDYVVVNKINDWESLQIKS